jgi:cob(I)alamin adenosyltransferase
MRLFTGRGDRGETDLLGARVGKTDPRIEAIGALDEASSAIGLARAVVGRERTRLDLVETQRDLYKIMAELAFTTEHYPERVEIGPDRLTWLEAETDALMAEVPPLREFVLPGETAAGAALDWARVMARRAERRVVAVAEAGEASGGGGVRNPNVLPYLNRLSSILFALARWEEHEAGEAPIVAKTGEHAGG